MSTPVQQTATSPATERVTHTEDAGKSVGAAPAQRETEAPAPAGVGCFASVLSSCYSPAPAADGQETTNSWGIFAPIQPCLAPVFAVLAKCWSAVTGFISNLFSSIFSNTAPRSQEEQPTVETRPAPTDANEKGATEAPAAAPADSKPTETVSV